jgi:hypothetical protein
MQQQQQTKRKLCNEFDVTQVVKTFTEDVEISFISFIYLSPFHTMWSWEQDLAPVFQFLKELIVGCQRVTEPVL